MELIAILEKKVEGLLELLRTLREENVNLKEENKALKAQILLLEDSLLKENKSYEQKLVVTEKTVNDLLKSIDELIESEG